MNRSPRLAISKAAAIAIGAALLTSFSAFAQDEGDLAKQTQNPVADLISLPFQNNFLFDEDVESDMEKQQEYGDEEMEEEEGEDGGLLGADGRPVSKGSNFQEVQVLKQAEF